MKYVYTPVTIYLMPLVHFHYYISASPSKLFALHLHAISHVHTPNIPMLLLHCTCNTSHECMSSQITQIDSNFDFLWSWNDN